MPKITVMSAEKAFLAAHYGGPFNKEDYIIVSITDTRYEADCPVVFRPVKCLTLTSHWCLFRTLC